MNLCGLGLLRLCLGFPSSALLGGGIGVELEHSSDVGERVLFAASLDGVGLLGCPQSALDFVALHKSLEVGVLDDSAGDAPVLL